VKRSRHVRRLGRLAPDLSRNPFLCGHFFLDEKRPRDHSRDGADCRPLTVPLERSDCWPYRHAMSKLCDASPCRELWAYEPLWLTLIVPARN